MRSLETTNRSLYIIIQCISYFYFWSAVFSVTWLVAFKYHSKLRQLLRIERLTKARIEKINRLKTQVHPAILLATGSLC
jgi:hypothetical protein